MNATSLSTSLSIGEASGEIMSGRDMEAAYGTKIPAKVQLIGLGELGLFVREPDSTWRRLSDGPLEVYSPPSDLQLREQVHNARGHITVLVSQLVQLLAASRPFRSDSTKGPDEEDPIALKHVSDISGNLLKNYINGYDL